MGEEQKEFLVFEEEAAAEEITGEEEAEEMAEISAESSAETEEGEEGSD